MRAVYESCRKVRLPIGIAPNIEVSLVVNPDDTALLAPRIPSGCAVTSQPLLARGSHGIPALPRSQATEPAEVDDGSGWDESTDSWSPKKLLES